ncbi:LANO_0F14862g1_1 [Lachancea nothofagi CBS 11611]|uniref:LANO_0F14862g1_1 n=1 Tax=Lachancea nothofagi CBS 11611 TaxID=1266666 RepID=A0A1G4KCG0_9SACH|nr:LANO_0F14862g1_1 [Lachancea nothofagi CBS 11611]
MQVKPCFISLIDSNDHPLLIHVVQNANSEIDSVLKFNTFSNMALDYFESDLYEWMSTSQQDREIKDLFQLEGVTVYGKLIKQTSLKIIIGFFSNLDCDDEALSQVFGDVSSLYVKCKFNPFVINDEELIAQLQIKFSDKF